MANTKPKGPLAGLRVVEFAGLGPAPFCGMLLADQGAEVILLDRPGTPPPPAHAVTNRGKIHLPVDLKQPAGVELCLALIERAEILIEGFRPGVMERLGLGPQVALARNPALVYGRMTGWGQDGPYAQMAGHDINYIAITGALHAVGTTEQPLPPANLVGDFGGGAMYLAFGVMAALSHARASGEGQVVDAAITDGAASLMAMLYGYMADGKWNDARRANRFDGGAHYYDTYQCSDGEWISLGAIEPQFYAEMLRLLDIDDPDFADQVTPSSWGPLREKLAARIRTRTRDEWNRVFEGTDACFGPVMSMTEAPAHPHNVARRTFIEREGVVQPAPAPRFGRTPGEVQDRRGDLASTLTAWGVAPEIARRASQQG
jgi:alpha-methylacyl-CoA racemase